MAIVYLADDLKLGRQVAIKLMRPSLFMSEGMEDRFRLEARTAAKLSHPNIITIHAVEQADDLLFFVMQFIDGAPLDRVLARDRTLSVASTRSLLIEVAGALHFAHQAGVVHRDVKPSNVMLTTRGTPVVTDFGIAKVAASNQHLTSTGSAIGTPTYMSPEQCSGMAVSPASDQYSLGVMAYELLVGEPPFVGSTLEVQWSHATREPRAISERNPAVPSDLASAIMRTLAKEPTDRFRDLDEFILAIRAGFDPYDPSPHSELAQGVRDAGRIQDSLEHTTPSGGLLRGADAAASPDSSSSELATPAVPDLAARSIVVGERIDCAAELGGARADEWQSSDPAIIAISATGEVVGLAVGYAEAVAKVQDRLIRRSFRVTEASAVRVEISPAPPATGKPAPAPQIPPATGDPVALPGAGRRIAPRALGGVAVLGLVAALGWGLSLQGDGSRAATATRASLTPIDSSVTGESPSLPDSSPATVTSSTSSPASVASIRGTISLTISELASAIEVGDRQRLQAMARDAAGKPLAVRDIRWRSGTPDIATVDGSGMVTGRTAGVAEIEASLGERRVSTRVTVTELVPARVEVSLDQASIATGESTNARAATFTSSGRRIEYPAAVFESSRPEVASISANGAISARAAGQTTIRVRAGGVVGSTTLTVVAGSRPAVSPATREPAAAPLAIDLPPRPASILPRNEVDRAVTAFTSAISNGRVDIATTAFAISAPGGKEFADWLRRANNPRVRGAVDLRYSEDDGTFSLTIPVAWINSIGASKTATASFRGRAHAGGRIELQSLQLPFP